MLELFRLQGALKSPAERLLCPFNSREPRTGMPLLRAPPRGERPALYRGLAGG